MTATIIMGGQWGDEGKGKLTDALASTARMVVRGARIRGGAHGDVDPLIHTPPRPAGKPGRRMRT